MKLMSLGLAVSTVACELLDGPSRTLFKISKTDSCKPTWERALAWEGLRRSHDSKCRSLPSQQNLPWAYSPLSSTYALGHMAYAQAHAHSQNTHTK